MTALMTGTNFTLFCIAIFCSNNSADCLILCDNNSELFTVLSFSDSVFFVKSDNFIAI